MADWQRTLDLSDVWPDAEKNYTPKAFATLLADRLEKIEPFKVPDLDQQRDDLVEALRDFEPEDSWDALNTLLDELYDWADLPLEQPVTFNGKKACWVKTF